MAARDVITRIVADELVPLYADRIERQINVGTTTRDGYLQTFISCCRDLYDKHLEVLAAVDVTIFESFGELVSRRYEDYMAEWKDAHVGRDISKFAKWKEEQTLAQQASADERQRLWEDSLGWIKDEIPHSQRYDQRIRRLAYRLIEVGKVQEDSLEQAHRMLWDMAFLEIMQRTGATRGEDGRPRRIEDVLEFGHLSNQLRGEYGLAFHGDYIFVGMSCLRQVPLSGSTRSNWQCPRADASPVCERRPPG